MFRQLLLTLFFVFFPVNAFQQSPINELTACQLLSGKLHGLVTLPDSQLYAERSNSYWATNQGQLHPLCYVSPRTTTDLQRILYALHEHAIAFSVCSGGHSSVVSTSNIAGGVTIDLSAFNTISLSADHRMIRIGPGARWSGVYSFLSQYPGYAVSGARAGTVGVGGYLLGGGLSIFNSLTGWGCDTITAMEVLLPKGTLMEASPSSDASLFTALKGTSPNLGIVTSFTLPVAKLPEGQIAFDVVVLSYPYSRLEDIMFLLSITSSHASTDPYLSTSVSLSTRNHNEPLLIVSLQSLLAHRAPEILRPFFDLDYINILYEPMSQATFANLVDDGNPPGFCQHKTTFTSTFTASYASSIAQSYITLFHSSPNYDDAGFQASMLMQPLTVPHLRHAHKTDNPNVLGLSEEPEPLLLYSFEIRHTYNHSMPDKQYPSLLRDFIRAHEEDSEAHAFRYPNYASAEQDVFGALKRDEKEWAWLQDVREKYDPDGWWKKWHGGEDGPFKIK